MPFFYVTTKFTIKGKEGKWASMMSPSDRDEFEADIRHQGCQGLRFHFIDLANQRFASSLPSMARDRFGPDNAFKTELNKDTGEYSITFDGVFKIAMDGDLAAAVLALPKKTPTTMWANSFSIARTHKETEPICVPCMVSKTKPKDISF